MDPNNSSSFPSNMNNTSASYSQPTSNTPQTLPPLQPQSAAMQSLYGTPTPRTPGTPNTPGSTSGYPPPTSTLPPTSRAPYIMSTPQYPTHQQGYGTSSSMISQSTSAASHPQPIAAAPPVTRPASTAIPPALRPIASAGVMASPGMGYGQSIAPQPSMMGPEGEQPTHVVGSQGRRGILPSAPGRPPAAPAGSAAAKSTVPVKDADGKYPCPHCVKTYLHAKHLKRHLLRHTGDRPYMCVLCRDTFSRSDILKRHFQKCSIRRGNPQGISHLSHPSAHVKKYKEQQAKAALENGGDLSQMNGLGNLAGDGMVSQYGAMPVADDQSRDRRSMPGPIMGGNTYTSDVPTTMNPNMNAQIAQYNMQQGQNSMPMFAGSNPNQQSNVDWSQMFQAGAHPTYVNTFPPNIGQTQIAIKEPSHLDPSSSGGVPGVDDSSLFFDDPTFQQAVDPYQSLSTRILNFLSSTDTMTNSISALSLFFSRDNIKNFLVKYAHFHAHFVMLHIPTFRILEAYAGLLVGICCVGACYSDRVEASQIHQAMRCLKITLENDSSMFRSALADQQCMKTENLIMGADKRSIEELQAMMLIQILFLWNGTPEDRETARRTYPLIASIARKVGLLSITNEVNLYSPLHDPEFSPAGFDIATFNWYTWAEQEKRLRIMHIIFLYDTALALYFNVPQQFEAHEIRVPLPADDAAWDARTSVECAEALGLHGPTAARMRNPNGTQRSKQPELDLCLKALHSRDYLFREGATNLYGKFVLIHALISQLCRALSEGRLVVSNSGMPLAQNDWLMRAASVTPNGDRSGRVTPVLGQSVFFSISDILGAIEKFKAIWDSDIIAQFPPSSHGNLRRIGFCRDAIHFYWVAKYLAKNATVADLQMSSEDRFKYVISLLKSVKAWVESDGATRGEEMGSINTIDKDYGVTNLTCDMSQLFTPIPGLDSSTPSGGLSHGNGL